MDSWRPPSPLKEEGDKACPPLTARNSPGQARTWLSYEIDFDDLNDLGVVGSFSRQSSLPGVRRSPYINFRCIEYRGTIKILEREESVELFTNIRFDFDSQSFECVARKEPRDLLQLNNLLSGTQLLVRGFNVTFSCTRKEDCACFGNGRSYLAEIMENFHLITNLNSKVRCTL
ncbi:hypothetical protein ACJJTC_002268 [Scirpophaga incertulas]